MRLRARARLLTPLLAAILITFTRAQPPPVDVTGLDICDWPIEVPRPCINPDSEYGPRVEVVFDPVTRLCQTSINACDGHRARFDTEAACKARCIGKIPWEKRWTEPGNWTV